jgi:hypothetical protein
VFPFGTYLDDRTLSALWWFQFDIAPLQLIAGMAFLLVPFAFLLVPTTLRQAKAQRVHLLRIWAYSLVWAPLFFGATAILIVFDRTVCGLLAYLGLRPSWRDRMLPYGIDRWSTLVATMAWLLLWWTTATRLYLRIPHGAAVVALLTFASLLVSTLAALLLYGPGLFLY